MNITWEYKYNPEKIEDMVLSESVRKQFSDMIKSKKLSNMTLAGIQGIGKTTLANILAKEFDAIIYFNKCGSRNSVSDMEGELRKFCESETIGDRLKVVILDEADQLSGGNLQSSAQKSLRNIIDEFKDDTRFILTCNYPNDLLGPIKSRCPVINIKYQAKDVLERLRFIMDSEGVKYNKETLKQFIDEVIKPCYPDIRQMITRLEMSCTSGDLNVTSINESVSEFDEFINELMNITKVCKDVNDIRKNIIKNTSIFNNDYQRLGTKVFNKVAETSNNVKLLLKLAQCLYMITQVSDPEIQMFGMMLNIKEMGE